ncbi:MAG: DUF971 domain-containing protein [Alphaproteobacteria bacterium]|nr:DUF971 domain-containing protein [Alphaproteobacteria bacterium]
MVSPGQDKEESHERIEGVQRHGNRLRVRWHDGSSTDYHCTWLRDWCSCGLCRNRYVNGATESWFLAPDIEPVLAAVGRSGALEVTWPPDGHVSVFAPGWLRERRECRSSPTRPTLWARDLGDALPSMDCDEVYSSEERQLRLLRLVGEFGFALVRNVPARREEVERLAGLLGYEPGGRRHWGRADDVMAIPNTDNATYAHRALRPHTDYTYAAWPPGLFVFHCLRASPDGGGVSLLVDGFHIAETMRRESPDLFELLARMPMAFRGEGSFVDEWRAEGRIFTLDPYGNMAGVRFSPDNLLPVGAPEDRLDLVYEALHDVIRRITAPENQIRIPLSASDCLVIDNHRVLHGRMSFNITQAGRHLQSVYIDRDDVRTRHRVLARQSNQADLGCFLPFGARG